MDDLYADTDSVNLYKSFNDEESLETKILEYYSDAYNKRFTSFSDGRTKTQISNEAYTYTKYKYFVKVWPLYEDKLLDENDKSSPKIVVKDAQSRAARDGYTEFIWERVQSEE